MGKYEMTKPTKEQFLDYIRIQYSGVTNMCAVNTVCLESIKGLTRAHCMYIMAHYNDLMQEYQINVTDDLLESLERESWVIARDEQAYIDGTYEAEYRNKHSEAKFTDAYITQSEILSIMDDIEKYHKTGELAAPESEIRKSIAERIIRMEKEEIRLALIYEYNLNVPEDDFPSVLGLFDRDSIMCQHLINEPYKVCRWAEDVGIRIFDDFRHLSI